MKKKENINPIYQIFSANVSYEGFGSMGEFIAFFGEKDIDSYDGKRIDAEKEELIFCDLGFPEKLPNLIKQDIISRKINEIPDIKIANVQNGIEFDAILNKGGKKRDATIFTYMRYARNGAPDCFDEPLDMATYINGQLKSRWEKL